MRIAPLTLAFAALMAAPSARAQTPAVAINEFMADNDTTAADQDGEFDDWIELYNNTAAPVALSGYYLSDDAEELTKWAFPDTTIGANSYLIVWADGDTEQAGLHADFGLGRGGEAIYFTLPDGTTIADEVTFGAQTTDISTGRVPNGTGAFAAMTPSFGAANFTGIVSAEDAPDGASANLSLRSNFPNPFSASTAITFSLAETDRVTVSVYNAIGQKVETLLSKQLPGGTHTVTWQADGYASGLYVYTVQAGSATETRTMNIVR